MCDKPKNTNMAITSSDKKMPAATRMPCFLPPVIPECISVKKAGPKLSMLINTPCPMPLKIGNSQYMPSVRKLQFKVR